MANFFNGYSQQPQYPQYPQYQQTSNNVIVVTVQGESGASMYPVAAGNTVLLIDFNLKKFWIKATDINGMPAKFAAFDFTEAIKPQNIEAQDFVPRCEFDKWKNSTDAQLKTIIENLNVLVGGKSNVTNAQ